LFQFIIHSSCEKQKFEILEYSVDLMNYPINKIKT